MKDLDEAWEWYRETREQLKLWRRILDKYWALNCPGKIHLSETIAFAA
jgi:hypothetical protein